MTTQGRPTIVFDRLTELVTHLSGAAPAEARAALTTTARAHRRTDEPLRDVAHALVTLKRR